LAMKFEGKRMRWIVFAILAFVILLMPFPLPPPATASRTVRVEAGNFSFNPGVIFVNRGEQVTLELLSTDVVHGLHLEGYDLRLVSDPGQTSRVTFTADAPGTFRIRCSVTCGPLHPFMVGKVVVGANTLFWRGIFLSTLAVLAGIWTSRK